MNGCLADAANKERCPMFGHCEGAPTKIDIEDATRVIEIMQKWSDEQPEKHTHRTYLKNENEKGR